MLSSLTTHLTPEPTATSVNRPSWGGVVLNWHNWHGGGHVSSPELDHDVIAMRTSGVVRLTQSRDGKTHSATVSAGNVTVHPRGMESRWSWDKPGAILITRIPTHLLREAAEATLASPSPLIELINCFGGRDPFIERIGLLMLEELRAPSHPAQEYITQCLSHALACHMVQRFGAEQRRPQRLPPGLQPATLQRVKDFIQAHLHEPIDLATLAGIANVSRFHFARMFRASAGMTAMAYLEQCRMQRAQDLIRAGTWPLSRVADLVGYDDQSYFTRRFRLFCGMTPMAYARQTGLKELLAFQ